LPDELAVSVVKLGEPVMGAFARLVHDCRRTGLRPRVLDASIAATAVADGLPPATQDDEFAALATAHPALAILRV
jgi:predicted nucleic acid-binding protein